MKLYAVFLSGARGNCLTRLTHLFIDCFPRIKFLALAQGDPKNLYMAPCSKCLETPDLEKL